MTKRPSFSDLPLASKPIPTTPSVVAVPEPSPDAAKAKDERVTIILRVSAEDRRALKMIAARENRTIQDMMHDAMEDIIRRSR